MELKTLIKEATAGDDGVSASTGKDFFREDKKLQ